MTLLLSESNTRTARRLAVGAAGLLVATFGVTVGLQATAHAAAPTCFGKKATIVGGDKGTRIRGTTGDDVIYAANGDDEVYGLAGDDLICGGYGADQLHGGPGNDWLAGQAGAKVRTASGLRIYGDVLYGDYGDDFLSPGFDGRSPTRTPDRISYADSADAVTANAATHKATGQGEDTWLGDRAQLIGSPQDDTLIGGPRSDSFQGGDGADKMSGGGGNDVIRDDYDGVHHSDRDTLQGGPGNDQLFTMGGFDTLDGDDGDDLLSDYGHDAGSMQGGTGEDVINDAINGAATQVDDGGPGVDTVNLYTNMSKNNWPRLNVDLAAGTGAFKDNSPFRVRSADRLYVHGAPLTFRGDAADNLVYTDGTNGLAASGNAGDDTFFGSVAGDDFDGGPGSDRADSLGGGDTCVSIETLWHGPCPAG